MTRRETLLRAVEVLHSWNATANEPLENVARFEEVVEFIKTAPHGSYNTLAWDILGMYTEILDGLTPMIIAMNEEGRRRGIIS